MGAFWTVVDDGLSRNGTQVNGEAAHGRTRLRDRDTIRMGDTLLRFRDPVGAPIAATAPPPDASPLPSVSPAQRLVLVALCRPYKDDEGFETPATNQRIADELVLSVEAVKSHLRAL